MRIRYCFRYSEYVSRQYCEFFNQGGSCGHAGQGQWKSIKDLSRDKNRPKREVSAVIRPFNCNLMDRRVP